jgi:DNA-binding response OmpR family regulator
MTMGDWDEITARGSKPEVESEARQTRKTRKKILLVDDSETVLMVERVMLSRMPYDLIVARDGDEALERALGDKPDLILLDVMMPGRNGFEVLKQLRATDATRELPIIMVTTRSEGENVESGYLHGCTDYVNKPFTAHELLTKVRGFLGQ